MKFLFGTILVFISLQLTAQHSLIYDVPNTPEILKKNKVKEIHIREKIDEEFKITNKYFIKNGIAFEHHYSDPYDQTDGNVIERSWRIPDSTGWVNYSREVSNEEKNKVIVTHRFKNHYSPGKKLLFSEQRTWADYLTIRRIWFDTLHPEFEKREEYNIFNEDTLFYTKDDFDGIEKNHFLNIKSGGEWREKERTKSIFEKGVLMEYYQYSFGKLVDSYDKNEFDRDNQKLGTDDMEQEFGLPIPDPFTETFYVNDLNVEKMTEVKKAKAKYRLEVHYDQGKNSDPIYTFYENASGLIHTKFGKDKSFYTEFLYVMGE